MSEPTALELATIQQLFDEIARRTESATLAFTVRTEEPKPMYADYFMESGFQSLLLGLADMNRERLLKNFRSVELEDEPGDEY